jgi:DNA/RNA endonuclease G (NUC1)
MRIRIASAAVMALVVGVVSCSDRGILEPGLTPTSPLFTHEGLLPTVRVSEFHYDNTGVDAGEAMEISGPAGTSLIGWQLVLYNGNPNVTTGLRPYDTKALTGSIPATCGTRGVVVITYPSNGIQNGSTSATATNDPDGWALVDPTGHVVEFRSYEGVFTAMSGSAGGPAAGMTSTDIGVRELGNAAEGVTTSLQLDGAGLWTVKTPRTFDACNDVGTTPPPPVTPQTIVINELMADPHQAHGGASWGEWFEVHNYGTEPVNLQNWKVSSAGQATIHTIGSSVIVPAGGFAVLGRGADITLNGGITIDYNYFTGSSTIFLDQTDWLRLSNPSSVVVDEVQWTSSTTIKKGVTRALVDASVDNANVDASNWRYSTTTFGDGDFGTPDAANGTLSDTPPTVPNTIRFSGRTSSDPALPVGFEDQIFALLLEVDGDTVDTEWTWSTVTPVVASIDQDGVMRALSAGTATIRATATADGSTRTYSLPTRIPVASATAVYAGNAEFGVPADADPTDDINVERPQYTSSYSPTRGIPNWVSYNLELTHFGPEDRCDCFTFDDALPATLPRYTTADYTGAGDFAGYRIDRGHLARSFDRTAGSLDNATTFYFSNIIPQAADNNQGPWADFETYLGNLARFDNKEVYIIAGAAGSKGTVKNEGKIVIPASTWKVAVILPRNDGLDDVDDYGDPTVIAVIMPNDPGIQDVDWTTYKTPVNAVEALSGYNLLALLPDDIEFAVESGVQTALVLVEALVADGKLNKGNGNALTVKLEHAARRLDGGHTTPAVNQLEAFVQHVNDLEAEGKLSATDAGALRAAATQVIESVSN